jgi:hypothetical protein
MNAMVKTLDRFINGCREGLHIFELHNILSYQKTINVDST